MADDGGIWAWNENKPPYWQPYDARLSAMIEQAFRDPTQTELYLVMGGGRGGGGANNPTHMIDLNSLCQINLSTQFTRPIRRQLPPGAEHGEVWAFQDTNGWCDDHAAISAMCSIARDAGRAGTTKYAFHGHQLWAYWVDFQTMQQINSATNKTRPVRYTPNKKLGHSGGGSSSGSVGGGPPRLPLSESFKAISPTAIDLSALTNWQVLPPGGWPDGEDDPIMCFPLGEGGEPVVRLPCHTAAVSCTFNKSTLDEAFKTSNRCPTCGTAYAMPGPQPSGMMRARHQRHEDCDGHPRCGTIEIEYSFPDGMQLDQHPNPGMPYRGTRRVAYLPCDAVGSQCFGLLLAAFRQGQLFRVGSSVTTGNDNTVVWSIHQKTSTSGGPVKHGWPDPEYVQRLQSECAAANVKGALVLD